MAGSREAGVGQASNACLFLLFRPGMRPGSDAISQVVAQSGCGIVSHDPRQAFSPEGIDDSWLELLVEGLTFDVLGLSPLEGVHWPGLRHDFGIAPDEIAPCEAIVIAPGPHLSGAANAIPVIRTMMGMASTLLEGTDGAVGVVWQPSASAIGKELFGKMIGQWLEGGPFPALGLTGVTMTEDGGLASDGLAFFTGQEIEIDAALSSAQPQATRLAVRLIDHLVNQDKIEHEEMILGPGKTRLRLSPMAGGRILRVSAMEGDVPGGALRGIDTDSRASALPGGEPPRWTGP